MTRFFWTSDMSVLCRLYESRWRGDRVIVVCGIQNNKKHNCWNKCFTKTLLSLASLTTSNKLMGSVVDAFKTALILMCMSGNMTFHLLFLRAKPKSCKLWEKSSRPNNDCISFVVWQTRVYFLYCFMSLHD